MSDTFVSLFYIRNTVSSKSFKIQGHDFGVDIEPSGEYMSVDMTTPLNKPDERWEVGVVDFNKPMLLEHKSSDSLGWKKHLSEKYNGATGEALTDLIIKDGYDGILTFDKYGLSESVNLSGIKRVGDTVIHKKNNDIGSKFSEISNAIKAIGVLEKSMLLCRHEM